MKRTFVAVKVSQDTKLSIKKIIDLYPDLKKQVNLVNLENMHITLKFLGDTKESDIIEAHENLEKELSVFEAFDFEIVNAGCFPNKHRPKVLWFGINKGLKKLQSLHNLTENIFDSFGYGRENRKYVPHLTLGRVKKDVKRIDFIDRFLGFQFQPTKNIVNEVIWFESLLTPRGAIHKPLRKYILK